MDAGYFLNGLVKRGLPEHIAAGFVENFQDESGLNPAINEIAPLVPGSRGGFGLSQWTGPRRRALEAFAAQQGRSVSDPDLQMDFLVYELQGAEGAAWDKISATKTPGEAAAAVVNYYLRPAEEHRKRREAKYLGGVDMPTFEAAPNALAGPTMQPQQNALAYQPPPPAISNFLDPAAFMNPRRGYQVTPL